MTHPGFDGYSYYISNDSDEEHLQLDSSDDEHLDEINVFLRGTPEQKRKALKSLTGDESSSSDDDFEKVMQGELEAKVKAIENSWKKSGGAQCSTSSTSKLPGELSHPTKPEYYDDIYFDSDDEDKPKKQRLTDDELLYDPSADDEDQKWVDRQRKHMEKKISRDTKETNTSQLVKGSDAILTCPACMTTLCVDCQRHALYENQYRAMFVMSCDVKFDELLHYTEKKKKQFKRHKKRAKNARQGDEEQPGMSSTSFTKTCATQSADKGASSYHPVKCTVCSTEVGVYDSDEIYHFFNVLSGYA